MILKKNYDKHYEIDDFYFFDCHLHNIIVYQRNRNQYFQCINKNIY